MAYKCPVDRNPIKGKNWTLSFGLCESTGGVDKDGSSVNFTCASSIMWNINFTSNDGKINAYSWDKGGSPVPLEERYELYAQLVDRFKDNTFMVQMVGVVNGGTMARARHYLQSENKHNYHTHDFANYLIKNKVGMVVESPVFVNTYHKWQGPSICQAWFWFSPSILEQGAILQHTGGIHGKPTKWMHEAPFDPPIPTFDDVLSPNIVAEERFKGAAALWNDSQKAKGIKPTEEYISKVAELWKRKVV